MTVSKCNNFLCCGAVPIKGRYLTRSYDTILGLCQQKILQWVNISNLYKDASKTFEYTWLEMECMTVIWSVMQQLPNCCG